MVGGGLGSWERSRSEGGVIARLREGGRRSETMEGGGTGQGG